MKIILKNESTILKEIKSEELTDQQADDLHTEFDRRTILRYEIVFKEGVCLGDCHRLDSLPPEKLKEVILTIE